MSNLYAMRRANGDWFTLEDDGRLLIPVFQSSHDAIISRLRTVEMLVFSPIALTAQLLSEIVDEPTAVHFCLISNPFATLKRGGSLSRAELLSLINTEAPSTREMTSPSSAA